MQNKMPKMLGNMVKGETQWLNHVNAERNLSCAIKTQNVTCFVMNLKPYDYTVTYAQTVMSGVPSPTAKQSLYGIGTNKC